MNSSEALNCKDVAPLGLEFEWPPNIWVLITADGKKLARLVVNKLNFYAAFTSESEAAMAAPFYSRSQEYVRPSETSREQLIQRALATTETYGWATPTPEWNAHREVFYVR